MKSKVRLSYMISHKWSEVERVRLSLEVLSTMLSFNDWDELESVCFGLLLMSMREVLTIGLQM